MAPQQQNFLPNAFAYLENAPPVAAACRRLVLKMRKPRPKPGLSVNSLAPMLTDWE
jgi:hypothetical protein